MPIVKPRRTALRKAATRTCRSAGSKKSRKNRTTTSTKKTPTSELTFASLLTDSTTKLGNDIWAWPLPAIASCPGRSVLCETICYADDGNFLRPNVIAALHKRWRFSKTRHFVSAMIQFIKKRKVRIVRIHTGGDLYSLRYIRRWIKIVRACTDCVFFIYTRSWRVPQLLPAIRELGSLSNLRMWYSCDAETGAPPKDLGVRRAWLSRYEGDWPSFPVDLVFRDETTPARKRAPAGELICPYENGFTKGLDCSKCGICWNTQRIAAKPQAEGSVVLLPILQGPRCSIGASR